MIKKQNGVSLLELMLVLSIATALPLAAITMFNESNPTRNSVISEYAKAIPFDSIEACLAVNTKLASSKDMRYDLFKNSCHNIWMVATSQVTESSSKTSSMVGVVVIKDQSKEYVFPILETQDGDLIYPGGAKAALEATKLTKEQVKEINDTQGRKNTK
ncbi:Tfp pilus assembly protein FimT/FimU [Vibrio splendidus]|nr:hypothetical protein [Vibrio splendidus]MCC4880490.1 hypothetical protein [Vibrio splendidus]